MQYYLAEADIGKRRDTATQEKLADLNKYVKVSVADSLDLSALSSFDCVALCDSTEAEAVRYGDAARAAGVAFIAADVLGAAGRLFVDFGEAHTVLDKDGENERTAIVSALVKNDDGSVTVYCDGRSGLYVDDHVQFKELRGAEELNGCPPMRVEQVSFDTSNFTIAAASLPESFGDYLGPGGIACEVKVPSVLSFKAYSDSIRVPFPEGSMGLPTVDYGKFGRSNELHYAFHAVSQFVAEQGRWPAPHNAEDMDAVAAIAEAFAKGLQGDEGVVAAWTDCTYGPPPDANAETSKAVAACASVQLPALTAFIGGIAAQEIVKLTGKYTPLRQWLYWDAFEALPEAKPVTDFAGSEDRYHFSNVLFGNNITQAVRESRVFLVGAGALGCEYFKSFALAGVGTAGKGKITVTDMDNIETSNLNRQFLFRTKDVGAPKSVSAAAAAQVMNPDLKGRVVALEERVGGDTEGFFNDEFWGEIDIVTNALDNIPARQYMDDRCVWFSKPLLESGTLGTKANTQPIFPRMTKTYNDTTDVAGDAIPMCTLKNFPFQIEHCIEWARDQFEGIFAQSIAEAATFARDPMAWIAEWEAEAKKLGPGAARHKSSAVLEVLDAAVAPTWEHCVHQARLRFEDVFAARIKQLLHNFPEGKLTANGAPFWSGKKRMPAVAVFDAADPLHCQYVAHGAALYANCFGVVPPTNWASPESIAKNAATAPVPTWAPRQEVIKTDEDGDEVKEGAADDEVATQQAAIRLAAHAEASPALLAEMAERLAPEEFEKDDDSNHHIDFVTAASNLRAWNYRIEQLSRHETKVIAGKITPAIATTTCAVTGLNMIEFYKFIQFVSGEGIKQCVENTRESNINLAIADYKMFEAAPTKVAAQREDAVMLTTYRPVPNGFTKWDRVQVPLGHADVSVKGVFDFVVQNAARVAKEEAEANDDLDAFAADTVTPFMIGRGQHLLYNASEVSTHGRLSMNVFDAYQQCVEERGGPKAAPGYIVLDIFSGEIDGDDQLEVPSVVVFREPVPSAGAAAE